MAESVYTLPASYYSDEDTYARERQGIFGSHWLVMGHEDELPQPGDALARTVAGWPLLIWRAPSGELRGFHNVCRHRAGPLVWDGETLPCQVLRCRYHGWQYNSEGSLIRTPAFGSADDFSTDEYPLYAIRVQSWAGFLFVNLDLEARALEQHHAALLAHPRAKRMGGMRLHSSASHVLQCNWKTYVENYLEGYHIPYLHPSLSREIDMQAYQVQVRANLIVHEVPTRGDAATVEGFWAWAWPNVAFNVYAEGMGLERIVPLSSRQTRIEYLYFFEADVSPEVRDSILGMSRDVTLEDVRICEAVQRNLEAGRYERGRLSPRHETGVATFQSLVRGALAREDA